jgi:hypothetical protein
MIETWLIFLSLFDEFLYMHAKVFDYVMPVIVDEGLIKVFHVKESFLEAGFFKTQFLNLDENMITGKGFPRKSGVASEVKTLK